MDKSKSIKFGNNFKDLTGQGFGRWLVLAFSHCNSQRNSCWFCVCQCGIFRIVNRTMLIKGTSKSCGCLRRDLKTTHGMKNSPEYKSWDAMRQRCLNRNHIAYSRYGGKGIEICDRWLHSFANFYADIGPRPSKSYSIERLDNSGPYSPDNCVWATRKQQQANRGDNKILTYEGVTMHLSAWARKYALSKCCLSLRLKRGWSIEAALTISPQPNWRKRYVSPEVLSKEKEYPRSE